MVANVAVVTEMDKLEVRMQRDRQALERLAADGAELEATAAKLDKEDRRAKAALFVRSSAPPGASHRMEHGECSA